MPHATLSAPSTPHTLPLTPHHAGNNVPFVFLSTDQRWNRTGPARVFTTRWTRHYHATTPPGYRCS
ncbi:hypothetical protein E2C01_064692 [Portunus trituberculatus]|uniref:Uncharacterized protein n=1 Tax=Portunus trituberculatus TaxID=210409 RepID=A0A5B7HJU0_PORTR|nr:hypothetical protein [Portunus trituberculatus]